MCVCVCVCVCVVFLPAADIVVEYPPQDKCFTQLGAKCHIAQALLGCVDMLKHSYWQMRYIQLARLSDGREPLSCADR